VLTAWSFPAAERARFWHKIAMPPYTKLPSLPSNAPLHLTLEKQNLASPQFVFRLSKDMQNDLQPGNDQCSTPRAEIARIYLEHDYMDLDFHLTPNGWVLGNIRCAFKDVEMIKPPPVDRLLTLTHRTHQVSTHSAQLRSVRVLWRGEATDAMIAELRAKFPPPFDPTDENRNPETCSGAPDSA
jgi:hypothetical protein